MIASESDGLQFQVSEMKTTQGRKQFLSAFGQIKRELERPLEKQATIEQGAENEAWTRDPASDSASQASGGGMSKGGWPL